MTPAHSFPSISSRFGQLVTTLQRLMAAHAGLDPRRGPTSMRVWNYLSGLVRRFEVLLRDPHRKPRPPRVGRKRSEPKNPPPVPLPRGQGWLIRFAQPTVQVSYHLVQIINDPEMTELLAIDPARANRILRPLCRALGLTPRPDIPPIVLAPPKPRVPRPPRPRTPREPSSPRPDSPKFTAWLCRPLPPIRGRGSG